MYSKTKTHRGENIVFRQMCGFILLRLCKHGRIWTINAAIRKWRKPLSFWGAVSTKHPAEQLGGIFGLRRRPSLILCDSNLSKPKQTCLTRPSKDRRQLCKCVWGGAEVSVSGKIAGVIWKHVNYAGAFLSAKYNDFPLVSKMNAWPIRRPCRGPDCQLLR